MDEDWVIFANYDICKMQSIGLDVQKSPPVTADQCIELIRAMSSVQRALATRLSPLLEEQYGIDLRLIILLKHIAGGICHPGELASNSLESPSQITRQIDKLVAQGFIERTLDPKDSRRILLVLTAKARSMFEGIEQACADLLGPMLDAMEPQIRDGLVKGVVDLDVGFQAQVRQAAE